MAIVALTISGLASPVAAEPVTYWPATAILPAQIVQSLAREAGNDRGEGCSQARLLMPHLASLGAEDKARVMARWALKAADPELRHLAEPAHDFVRAHFICVTPLGEFPDGPPLPNAPCFSGVHPKTWIQIEAGDDGLIWLDDFVPSETAANTAQIHVVSALSAATPASSIRVRGAAADLKLSLFAEPASATTAQVYGTGPIEDAPYDQLVVPADGRDATDPTRAWLYTLVTPSQAGATRLGVRLAGPHGASLAAAAEPPWPGAVAFQVTANALRDQETSPLPLHPCAPRGSALHRAAFTRSLGLGRGTDTLETLAQSLPLTPAGAKLGLLILPAIAPASARHALLSRLETAPPRAYEHLIKRALAAVALDRGQGPRAELYANAAPPPARGASDGLRARIALAERRSGTTADTLSGCAEDLSCPPPLVALLVRAQLDIGLVADARQTLARHATLDRTPDLAGLWEEAHTGPAYNDRLKLRARELADGAPTRALLRVASARAHLKAGDRRGAEGELRRLGTKDNPTGWVNAAGTRLQIAEMYMDLGLLDDAREVIAWTLTENPADPWARALSDQLRARGNVDGRMPSAMRAILARLPDEMAGNFATPPRDLVTLAKTASKAPPEGFEILSEQLVVAVAADGSTTRLGRRILRRGPAAPGGAEPTPLRWPWDPSRVSLELVRAIIHRPEPPTDTRGALTFVTTPLRGIAVEAPGKTQIGLYYDELALVIPWRGVAEGDLVELVWTVSPTGQPFPGYFEFNEYLSSRIPRQAFDVHFIFPPNLSIEHRIMRAPEAALEISEQLGKAGDSDTLTVTVRGDPGLPNEAFAPPHGEVGVVLQATSVESWPALGAFYAKLMRGQARMTAEMKAAVATIVAANRSRTGELNELQTVRALAALVAQRVRYVGMEFGIHSYKPYRTEDVWKRRFGDCKDQALLLVTLLTEAGIEAAPVLVRTRRFGHLGTSAKPPLPMLALFDHAIVHLTRRDLFIDPTTIHHGFNTLAPDNVGADALVLPWGPAGETRLTRLPDGVASRNRVDGDFAVLLEADGSAIIQGRVAYRGIQAGAWRSRLADEATRDRLVQTMIANTFKGFTLSHFTVSGLDDRAESVRIVFEGEVQQLAQVEDQGLRIPHPLPLGGQRARVGDVTGRTLPFLLGTPGIGTFEVAWTFPPNYHLQEAPEAFRVESSDVRALVDWRAPDPRTDGPQTSTGRVELAFLSERVAARDLNALARALADLDAAIGTPLVLMRSKAEAKAADPDAEKSP